MPIEAVAVIALGANLQQPQQQIKAAIEAIATLPQVRIHALSSLYRTTPVGYAEQPDFVNAVMLVHTTLAPEELLCALQALESRFGRVRAFRNAPRTLDLDVIDYDHRQQHSAALVLPHPRAHERAFVMVPLAQIAPDYRLGTHGSAAQLAQQLLRDKPDEAVQPLASD